MGDQRVREGADRAEAQAFVKALLEDVRALEVMLQGGYFEEGVRRIGAEQEMFLVDRRGYPAPAGPEVLARLGDARLTSELARFNLEANLTPRTLGGGCLRAMEAELGEVLGLARAAAAECDADVVLCGILPTLRRGDLTLANMAPCPRYEAMNRAVTRARGDEFRVHIKGTDELDVTHDNVMLESCNTSFQVHYQVCPATFAAAYNVAQLVSAPLLAASVNSPLLFGRRLWAETRVALFQQSFDGRSPAHAERGAPPRVFFGERWVDGSVLEIVREDVARFRVLLVSAERDDDPFDVLARGGLPGLRALRTHNGTVYRWNRPCYGVYQGKAHLRVEARALPAGPSVVDEMASAALFFGLMAAGPSAYGDVARRLPFDEARRNFVAAAREGLAARLAWLDGRAYGAADLVRAELVPLAREGLAAAGVDRADVERLLGVVDERAATGRTGAAWALESLARLGGEGSGDGRMRALVKATLARQRGGQPAHRWAPAETGEVGDALGACETVGQFMTTDLYTLRPDDILDLARSVMDWEGIHHLPVEDDGGRLVGMVTKEALCAALEGERGPVAVSSLMDRRPAAVAPDTPTVEAVRLMRERKTSGLPVVEGGRLVGMVTERDLLAVVERLLDAPEAPAASGTRAVAGAPGTRLRAGTGGR
ncbi:MAG TPA: CBS domain-containing protein [Polyangiaceae bacterium]|nr:CBS domain-containing protein [Polyangiaceae bacterium]